jgi:glycosyltransferase involved in cell wall biosynthesis
VVHNAIDTGWGNSNPHEAARLRSQLGIPEDRNIILIVGRLSREKDHLTLLEAVRELPEPVHLLIVGEGPERARIEERIRETGQTESVTLTGQVASAEPYYAIAKVAVLSSLSEGSPNALLEAMAAGVPAVATAVGGIPEIVADQKSALLVPPGDQKAMRAAIARLIGEPELAARLVLQARELVRSKHSPEARTQRICQVYRDLLENAGAGVVKGRGKA